MHALDAVSRGVVEVEVEVEVEVSITRLTQERAIIPQSSSAAATVPAFFSLIEKGIGVESPSVSVYTKPVTSLAGAGISQRTFVSLW